MMQAMLTWKTTIPNFDDIRVQLKWDGWQNTTTLSACEWSHVVCVDGRVETLNFTMDTSQPTFTGKPVPTKALD